MDESSLEFLAKSSQSFGAEGASVIEKALKWAQDRHGSTLRASGEEAWAHDLRVASTLLDMRLDLDSIVAALVHDCTENRSSGYRHQGGEAKTRPVEGIPPAEQGEPGSETQAQSRTQSRKLAKQEKKSEEKKREVRLKALVASPDEQIAEAFGPETAMIVAGVARLSTVRAKNKTVQAAETMRKMLFAMTGDIRVIIVKLADKLDSMRTLKYLPEERQKTIAAETLDIFAPLADRLGISWRKDELEDLARKVLNRQFFRGAVRSDGPAADLRDRKRMLFPPGLGPSPLETHRRPV
jgi:(p)ppGpp synthase/HD superfamily hydrolase